MIERKTKLVPHRADPVNRLKEQVIKNTGPFAGREAQSFVSVDKIGKTKFYPY